MKKIITVLGARPQFIKAAVLSRIITEKDHFKEVIIHTGQHFDTNMSEVFFTEMEIPVPKYNLNINGLTHGAMTGKMIVEIEKILLIEKPNLVVVYGDTNSTFAGAFAARKLNIKVVHIEAGLRSFNMQMPEEINRILTDKISDLLLCPTEVSVNNLAKEGFGNLDSKIVKCGDIMKDAMAYYGAKSESESTILEKYELSNNNFVLATIHRQENTDNLDKLKSIFSGLEKISRQLKVIVPVHPRTMNILEKHTLKFKITMIPPVSYFDMLALLKNCFMVVTDSGGLQKEAFFNQKHCIIAREETEWVELVKNGFAKIVGSDQDKMIKAFNYFELATSDFSMNLYGQNVGQVIYKEVKELLG